MAVCFRPTNMFHQTSFSRRIWSLFWNRLKCWQLCYSKQRILMWTAVWFEQCPATENMTLPTSQIGAQSNRRMSKQSEMFITGSKLCHCTSCFFCVWNISSGRQLRHEFAIPETDLIKDACIIPNPLYPLVVCPYPWHAVGDMMNLQVNHPNIRAEVRAGKMVVYKISSTCSAMASDQCHEQDNGDVKVVGLTEHPSTVRR